MPAPTWAAGLFRQGGPDDLAEAERQVAILKAELEAIRAGRKEASAAELRKLERDYREAVADVQQLRVAQRPERPTEPRPERGAPDLGRLRQGITDIWQRLTGGVTTPRGYTARAGAPPIGGVGGLTGGVTTPRGYAAPVAGAPISQAGAPIQQIPAPGRNAFGPNISGMPGYARDALSGRGLVGRGGGAPVGRPSARYIPQGDPAGGVGQPTLEELYSFQGRASEFEAGSLQAREAEAKALQAYRMAQLGQGQAAAGATAAWRQQQAEQAQAQLKQAWMVAQAELAHAQNVMASQIGTSLSQQQGQMWTQGLPYALPQGTQVAPGFERGGPMQQLHRMSGAQFTPGRTGRISPQPPPSQQQLMQWVQQAMGQFGAGR